MIQRRLGALVSVKGQIICSWSFLLIKRFPLLLLNCLHAWYPPRTPSSMRFQKDTLWFGARNLHLAAAVILTQKAVFGDMARVMPAESPAPESLARISMQTKTSLLSIPRHLQRKLQIIYGEGGFGVASVLEGTAGDSS